MARKLKSVDDLKKMGWEEIANYFLEIGIGLPEGFTTLPGTGKPAKAPWVKNPKEDLLGYYKIKK